jgi:small subunit ribosomal protein S8
MPASKLKVNIARLLKTEGYIIDYQATEGVKPRLTIHLKYFEGQAVINKIKRVSRPGLRIYRNKHQLPKVLDGLGIAIISTSQGLMTDYQAREAGQGGEVLCVVQ